MGRHLSKSSLPCEQRLDQQQLVQRFRLGNEVHDLERKPAREHSRDDIAVTMPVIGLETEQADALPCGDDALEIFERPFRARSSHVLEKDPSHLLVLSCARGRAAICRCAERAQMEVVDPRFFHAGREPALRESRAPRASDRADVDEELDTRGFQCAPEALRRRALIADRG